MISIIICSINEALFQQTELNINSTIGIAYEVIKIDNANNNLSICDAYNAGAAKAKFPYLCFVHEDVIFTSTNWGLPLINKLRSDSTVGVIGIAGSKYKSLSPGAWPCGDNELDCYNIIQHYTGENKKALQINNPEKGQEYVEVKTLDGVFLFTKKNIWSQYQFDNNTFKGFHCYDLDFCLNVGKTHKLLVAYNISIEHLSTGNLNREWVKESILLSKKWKDHLPVGSLPRQKMIMMEWGKKRHFFLSMLIYGSTLKEAVAVLLDFGYFKFFYLPGNIAFAIEIYKSRVKKLIGKFS